MGMLYRRGVPRTTKCETCHAELGKGRPYQMVTQPGGEVTSMRLDRQPQQPLHVRVRQTNPTEGLPPCGLKAPHATHPVEPQAEPPRVRVRCEARERSGKGLGTDDVEEKGATEVVEGARLRGW